MIDIFPRFALNCFEKRHCELAAFQKGFHANFGNVLTNREMRIALAVFAT